MLVFLLSLLFAVTAVLIGGLVARVICIIPLSILARAEHGGRYARLGSCQLQSPAGTASGRRIPPLPLLDAGAYALALADVALP
jgi:hypothetical protein